MATSETDLLAAYEEVTEADATIARYKTMKKKFRKACLQIILLNNRIEDLKIRYQRAVRNQTLSFRYTTRVTMAGVEGVRNMIYEYACAKADELDRLQQKLASEGYYENETESEEEYEQFSEESMEADT